MTVPQFFRLSSSNAIIQFLLEVKEHLLKRGRAWENNFGGVAISEGPAPHRLSLAGHARNKGALHWLQEGRGPALEAGLRAVHPAADEAAGGTPAGIPVKGIEILEIHHYRLDQPVWPA